MENYSGGVINVEKLLLNYCHPVGSLYISEKSTDPATLFGGTWERIKDRFILAAGDSYSAGSTGGEATHTLTEAEMPSHIHDWIMSGSDNIYTLADGGLPAFTTIQSAAIVSTAGKYDVKTAPYRTSPAGGGAAHNNMPPYLAMYVWRRTA